MNRLDLQQMLSGARPVDNTNDIRRLKHSRRIADEVNQFMSHKLNLEWRNTVAAFVADNKRGSSAGQDAMDKVLSPAQIEQECVDMCPFLVEHYPDLFRRVFRGELDVKVLFELLNALAEIEDGDLTQEQGSEKVGRILFRLYADIRSRQESKNESKNGTTEGSSTKGAALTWKEYRRHK